MKIRVPKFFSALQQLNLPMSEIERALDAYQFDIVSTEPTTKTLKPGEMKIWRDSGTDYLVTNINGTIKKIAWS